VSGRKPEVGSGKWEADVRRSSDARNACRVVRLGLLGYGRVGQAVAAAAVRERETLRAAGFDVTCTRALVRDLAKPRSGPALRLTTDAVALFDEPIDVVVEVLGGVEPARTIVSRALASGIPVVTANKSLMAACGPALYRTAAEGGAGLACDAAVLAGVPFLGALSRRPIVAAARRLEGILNGTSQFIVGSLDTGVTFEDALVQAVARGYAEPDSAADTSGRDAAEKLAILLRFAGLGDIRSDRLPKLGLEALSPPDLRAARQCGGAIKPVAVASLAPGDEGTWIGPAFVDRAHPLAGFTGVDNVLRLVSAEGRVVTFAGPGAGPDATAATILDDVVEVLSGHRPDTRDLGRPNEAISAESLTVPPASRWFVTARSTTALAASLDVVRSLTATGVPFDRIEYTPQCLAALTPRAPWADVAVWLERLRATGHRVLAVPVIGQGL
jgi:homoserine dehydrogenase